MYSVLEYTAGPAVEWFLTLKNSDLVEFEIQVAFEQISRSQLGS